jgi:hypothetical protein
MVTAVALYCLQALGCTPSTTSAVTWQVPAAKCSDQRELAKEAIDTILAGNGGHLPPINLNNDQFRATCLIMF